MVLREASLGCIVGSCLKKQKAGKKRREGGKEDGGREGKRRKGKGRERKRGTEIERQKVIVKTSYVPTCLWHRTA